MPELKDRLIVALDVDALEKAEKIVSALGNKVQFYKVGSQLFTAYGPGAVEMVAKKGGKVFLDLKFHDIPNTVYSATASGTSPNVFMMTVHVKGGIGMLKKAAEGAAMRARELNIKKPLVVGVTRLTSEESTEQDVVDAARMAKEAGLDGVVCSALEAKKIREEFGKDFIIVTPGIRPRGSYSGDQKRVATAREAIEAGADYIVVGRPILEANDPLKAVDELLQ